MMTAQAQLLNKMFFCTNTTCSHDLRPHNFHVWLNEMLWFQALQALTNVWWQNIGKNIRCSETKFGQLFGTKHGRIIVYVFAIVLHKTQNHERDNGLCKNLHTV